VLGGSCPNAVGSDVRRTQFCQNERILDTSSRDSWRQRAEYFKKQKRERTQSDGGLRQAIGLCGLGKSAIDNLVDGVDRFSFTRAAAQDKYTRDELEMRIIAGVMAVVFAVLAQNDVRDAHRLTAMAAQNTAEMLRRQFDRH
jgi:hypothetical protein